MFMKKKHLLLILLMFFTAGHLKLHAQNIQITGTIIDSRTGEALPGVSIAVQGTTKGAISDVNGKYTIDIPDANATLIFSYVSYATQTIQVGGRSVVNAALDPDIKKLDELVVIGYGTMKKSDLTGAVASIKGDELMKNNPSSINQSLQGKLAGVFVSQTDGAPGSGISIQVRGANSFSSSTEPLYVIDGVPFSAGTTPSNSTNENLSLNTLSFLNPQDVASIEVLKDASATAIYGSRGANGVVLITTKKGKAGEDKVEFSATYGTSTIAKKLKMLNGYNYAKFQNEATQNRNTYEGTTGGLPFPGSMGLDPFFPSDSVYNPSPEDFLPGHNPNYPNGYLNGGTDWQDQIFRTGSSSEYNLSVNGGNEKGNYLLSANYLNQDGIIKGTDYTRYTLRLNMGRQVKKWLEVGTNTQITKEGYNMGKASTDELGIISAALFFPVSLPVHDSRFESGFADARSQLQTINPVAMLEGQKNYFNNLGIFTASYINITLAPGLKFKQNLGYNYSAWSRNAYYGQYTWDGRNKHGVAYENESKWAKSTFESILNYDKEFGVHRINAVVASTSEFETNSYSNMEYSNFPNDLLKDINLNLATVKGDPTSGKGMANLQSFLGRAQYTFKNKYMATASFRADGSTKFEDDNKWSYFKAFALAWKLSEEDFIKSIGAISELKLRASYGETGNQAADSYRTKNRYLSAGTPLNGTILAGYAPSVPGNKLLKWETTKQTDMGLELGLFKQKILFTADVYYKKTFDLLQNRTIPISTGYSQIWSNYGTVVNKGLELSATAYVIQNKDFSWNINGNISFNRNKIQDLPSDQFATRLGYGVDNVFIQRNGQPIGAIYGYVTDGFYDNDAEVRADPEFATQSSSVIHAMVGEQKYKNLDSIVGIGTGDRAIIGNTNPKYTFGITNNFQYKHFNLSFYWQGVMGGDIVNFNMTKITLGAWQNIPQFVYDGRWTPDNYQHATQPKANTSNNRRWYFSDRDIENGSYIRLKNVNLSYTFDNKIIKYIQNLTVFVSGTNLLTLTKYRWFDPDVSGFGSDASRRGVDFNSYPTSRNYTFGVRCTF
jgi:TonB-linked SusC/RagA family outer membrane protein